jgi:hypothetical protein
MLSAESVLLLIYVVLLVVWCLGSKPIWGVIRGGGFEKGDVALIPLATFVLLHIFVGGLGLFLLR